MFQVKIKADAGGVTFQVKVQPGAGRTALGGEWNGALKLKVSKKPEQGAANRACLEFLAEILGVPKRSVTLLQGERSHLKTIRVAGLTAAQVAERLK
jgi:uncharacterized protein